MNDKSWSQTAQTARRDELFQRHREMLRELFCLDGETVFASHPVTGLDVPPPEGNDLGDPRVRAWHCFAAFAGDEESVQMANGILRKSDFSPSYDFFTSALLQLYLRHAEDFAPDVRQRAEDCFAAIGPAQLLMPGFVGMNDNFGAMEIFSLAMAGQLTGRPELEDNAEKKLRDLCKRLDQSGTIAEFNSPTYTAITLGMMADLVNYSRNEAIVAAARQIETQLWFDFCARFHPPSSQMGGPSSRSYMADSCGHMYNARFLFHLVFGEAIQPVSPLRYSYGPENRMVQHHGNRAFIPANGCWVVAPNYHVPETAAAGLVNRQYPFEAHGTALCAFTWMPDEWRVRPEGREKRRFRRFQPYRFAPALLSTAQTEDICLGTSSGAHACGDGGQHDAFFLSWRRREVAPEDCRAEDVSTAFCRYVFNGARPDVKMSLLPDQGRKTCVQQGTCAIVAYRPGIGVLSGITSMRLVVVIPILFGRPEKVLLGDTPLPTLNGEARESSTVFIRDGRVALAFRPLSLVDYGRPQAVKVEADDAFLTLSFYNYDGPARSLNFPYQAALFTQNGFVIDAESTDDFAAFRQRVNQAVLTDEIKEGIRHIRYHSGDLDLSLNWDPTREDVVTPAHVRGVPRDSPRFWTSDNQQLPYPEK